MGLAAEGRNGGRKLAGENPFAKAALARYWKNQITNKLPKPKLFLDKASPLNAVALVTLSSRLSDFCSKANLLCAGDLSTSQLKHNKDINFTTYSAQSFANYGSKRAGGADSFKNYSNPTRHQGTASTRYSRGSKVHDDSFTTYAKEAVNAQQSFNSYAKALLAAPGSSRTTRKASSSPTSSSPLTATTPPPAGNRSSPRTPVGPTRANKSSRATTRTRSTHRASSLLTRVAPEGSSQGFLVTVKPVPEPRKSLVNMDRQITSATTI